MPHIFCTIPSSIKSFENFIVNKQDVDVFSDTYVKLLIENAEWKFVKFKNIFYLLAISKQIDGFKRWMYAVQNNFFCF
jgi:hypothetical protein